jgi:hypothetical protein
VSDELSNVELDMLAAPQESAPRVRAWVDGVKVQWKQRSSDNHNVIGAGWVCEEHGTNVHCWHTDDVEDVLADRVLARMRKYEAKSDQYLRRVTT